ncbi:MAG: hypothetical protein KGL95_01650, partial [Patescibacteria group bacterium]|nr:hypothetical protein [Patescibacteria group bacterium]
MKPIEVKQKALSRFLLTRLGGTGLTMPQDVENYIRIFVRLVDKAIREYNQIYELVMEEINEAKRSIKELEKGRILYADLVINELENCINTT